MKRSLLLFILAGTVALVGCEDPQAGTSGRTAPNGAGTDTTGSSTGATTPAENDRATPGDTTTTSGGMTSPSPTTMPNGTTPSNPMPPAATTPASPTGTMPGGTAPPGRIGEDARQPGTDPRAPRPAGTAGSPTSTPPSTPDGEAGATMDDLLGALAGLNGKPIADLSPEEARGQPGMADAVEAWSMENLGEATPEEVGEISEATYMGAGGELPVRVYMPLPESAGAPTGGLPVLVYWHGGGFVLGDLDTYDASCRALCNAAGCIVFAPAYRHAPENPFPAAPEDAYAAYQWVLANAGEYGGDPARVAVAGESAGGNLAAVVCLTAREEGGVMPVHQVLVYPLVNWAMNTESYREHADAKPLNRAGMEWFKGHYLGSEGAITDWRAAPLMAPDLTGLPPATIIGAEIDPLRSEGEMFADRLRDAGVAVNYRNFEGVTHEFFGTGVLPESKEAVRIVAGDLREAFGMREATGSVPEEPGQR